jgi:ubiquitin carboxyl-terminal hydrolase 14
MQLDLHAFCAPELQKQMAPYRDAFKQYDDLLKSKQKDEEKIKKVKLDIPKQTDLGANMSGYYELYAVLTHIGRSADSGHYMAWVRDGNTDNWWKFDDDKVSPVKTEDVLKLEGGGDW